MTKFKSSLLMVCLLVLTALPVQAESFDSFGIAKGPEIAQLDQYFLNLYATYIKCVSVLGKYTTHTIAIEFCDNVFAGSFDFKDLPKPDIGL